MKKLVYLLPTVVALALPACGDDTAADTDGDETGSTTSGSPTGDPTTETMTDPTVDPTSSTGDTETTDPTVDPDTGGSDSSSDDGGPQCDADDECTPETVVEDCGDFFTCIGCLCVEDGDPPVCPDGWGDGEYADCVTEGNGVCTSESGLTPGCVVDDVGTPTAGACFFSGCEEACDCPAPPDAAFDAQVTCDDIIGDTANDCYIDCSSDGCPDGMFCFANTLCIHGEEPKTPGEIPEYGDCLNDMTGMCADMGLCLSDGATFGACGTTGCADASDCSDAPPTGTAMPGCTDFPDGMDSFCSLTCDDGETCPDGMICLALNISGEAIGSHCMWPEITEGFADCINNGDGVCVDGEACVVDDTVQPNTGVCAASDCVDPGDCPSAPEGGDAVAICADIDGNAGDECALDCSGGEMCPTGMSCTGDGYCAWEGVPPVGFDDCANNPDAVCLEGETCVTDTDADPDTAVCAQSGCVDPVADCPAPPEGGDAMAACGDIDGSAGDECILDCSGGAMCPTGMVCTAGDYCAWEDAGFALFEDFSSGAFANGWLLFDVDGQTVNAAVSYVEDAWTVADVVVMGDPAAYSTSWYSPAGMSDDWMVSPPVPLTATSVLSWDGRAPDAMFADGYEVYVVDATDTDLMDFVMSGDPTAFLAAHTPVFTIDDENDMYTTRTLSAAAGQPLNGLVGSTVHVFWRNNSNDDFILMIDNISVTE